MARNNGREELSDNQVITPTCHFAHCMAYVSCHRTLLPPRARTMGIRKTNDIPFTIDSGLRTVREREREREGKNIALHYLVCNYKLVIFF